MAVPWWVRLHAKQRESEPFDDECLEAIAARRAWNKYGYDLGKLSDSEHSFLIGTLVFDLENRLRRDAWRLFDATIRRLAGVDDG